MRGRIQFVLLLVLLLMGVRRARSGEVIDGIVATVNGVAILHSDVEEAVRCEALLDGHPPAAITAAQREAALQRLIDQELLREQMAGAIPAAKPAEVAERIRQVRCSLGLGGSSGGACAEAAPQATQQGMQQPEKSVAPGVSGDQAWQSLLTSYDISEEELAERLSVQMQLTAFVESRLRSTVRVDAASIQTYYRDELLPQLRQRGITADPPLAQVSSQIEEILRQQRADQMLNTWLQNLRQQSRIRIGTELSGEGAAAGPDNK
jgi:hypothetical protein